MLKKSITQMMVVMFALTLFVSISASAQNKNVKSKARNIKTSQTTCSKTTDADLVKAIKEKFEADTEIKDQMQHINISVKKRVVTLEGWLDGKEAVAKAVAIVKKTKCVKKVFSTLKTNGGSVGCGAGQKACGGICIDKSSECTIVIEN